MTDQYTDEEIENARQMNTSDAQACHRVGCHREHGGCTCGMFTYPETISPQYAAKLGQLNDELEAENKRQQADIDNMLRERQLWLDEIEQLRNMQQVYITALRDIANFPYAGTPASAMIRTIANDALNKGEQ